MTRGDVDNVKIGEATVAAAEDNALAVRRPARPGDALERQIEALGLLARLHVEQIEDVAPLALGRERELTAIGRECALGVQKAQLFEVGIERALDQSRYALARFGVAEPEVDEHFAAHEAAIGQEGDVLPVWRERRREEDLTTTPALREQRRGELARAIEVGDLRQIPLLHVLLPFVTEILEGDAELALECALDADRRRGVHDLAYCLVAPFAANESPERMAVAIREEALWI